MNEISQKSLTADIISRLSKQGVLEASSEWTTEQLYDTQYTKLMYDMRVSCDVNYYGGNCSKLCKPQDHESFGHFTCSETGDIICLSGWQDKDKYCTIPKCTEGCTNGRCDRPNECHCKPGWKGALCDICETHPACVNGNCLVPGTCDCLDGWGGQFCNQDLIYCTHYKPCKNNGTCFNFGDGYYKCECLPGFIGQDCDTEIKSCFDNPCTSNGKCIDDIRRDSYRCECQPGWKGKNCQQQIITCSDKPCLNNGKCLPRTNGFHCECSKGFGGQTCNTIVDDCNSNPCLNGGTCISDSFRNKSSYHCDCPKEYIGRNCEHIDQCTNNPCENGGTCLSKGMQRLCKCKPGFIGSLCSEEVNLCIAKPCANGGTCRNLDNDYQCTCRSGFTGKDCSVDIDECSSAPCRNGGTCVNRVNSFQCLCSNGFRGMECDEEESYSASFDAQLTQVDMNKDDGLSSGQVVLIAILSVAMPVVAVIAACVVVCIKRKRKRDQDKHDAEARKQNEQNATAHHHIHAHRGSNSGLPFDNSNPNIIKNTWDKSVNNMSSSNASVEDTLLNSSIYVAGSYSDNNNASGDAFMVVSSLQRVKSQKQLNTDPILMHNHRSSQMMSQSQQSHLMDSKRLSVMGEQQPQRWIQQNGAAGSSLVTSVCGTNSHVPPHI
ncbi:DLL4 family protein [Megaselia abdita]